MAIDPLGLTALYLWTEHLNEGDIPDFFPRVAAAMARTNREWTSASGNHYVPGESRSEQIIAPFSQLPNLSKHHKDISKLVVVGHPTDYQVKNFDLGSVSTSNFTKDATIHLYGCTTGSGNNPSGQRFANYFQRTTYAPPGNVSFGYSPPGSTEFRSATHINLAYARPSYMDTMDKPWKVLFPVEMKTFQPQNTIKGKGRY
jgi:hypothetical protein